jgi:NAD(P)-dependent dehydrogenase (short-subunit alcohol dehydrogenase family)
MAQLKHNFKTQYGPWALVAGASEGLGRAYCLQLAQRGLSIAMAASWRCRAYENTSLGRNLRCVDERGKE